MAEGLITAVLKENNIELSEHTFRFHLKVLLEKHEGLLECISVFIACTEPKI
jgi:hypothetical protein